MVAPTAGCGRGRRGERGASGGGGEGVGGEDGTPPPAEKALRNFCVRELASHILDYAVSHLPKQKVIRHSNQKGIRREIGSQKSDKLWLWPSL